MWAGDIMKMGQDFDGEHEEELAYYQKKYYTLLSQYMTYNPYRDETKLWKCVGTASLALNILFAAIILWIKT
jgi:hypothetical protein